MKRRWKKRLTNAASIAKFLLKVLAWLNDLDFLDDQDSDSDD